MDDKTETNYKLSKWTEIWVVYASARAREADDALPFAQ